MLVRLRNLPWVMGMLLGLFVVVKAQDQAEHTNLQAFPQDIRGEELRDMMGTFTEALGVRCGHCHVRGEQGMEYAIDERETKTVARAMIRMVSLINTTLRETTGRDPADLTTVTCFTCHHANTTPERIEGLLTAEYDTGGADALLELYNMFREQYYGRAVYDFSTDLLAILANDIANDHSDTDGAVTLLEANLKLYPESDFTYYILGQTHSNNGDKTAAVSNFNEALRLAPNNRRYQNALNTAQAN